jgi:hypothetical protein
MINTFMFHTMIINFFEFNVMVDVNWNYSFEEYAL